MGIIGKIIVTASVAINLFAGRCLLQPLPMPIDYAQLMHAQSNNLIQEKLGTGVFSVPDGALIGSYICREEGLFYYIDLLAGTNRSCAERIQTTERGVVGKVLSISSGDSRFPAMYLAYSNDGFSDTQYIGVFNAEGWQTITGSATILPPHTTDSIENDYKELMDLPS